MNNKTYIAVHIVESSISQLHPLLRGLEAYNYKSDMIAVKSDSTGLEVTEISVQEALTMQLKDICKSRGLNLKDIAKYLNKVPTTFSKMLNNSDRTGMHLTLLDLLDIATYLNLTIVIEEKSLKIIEKS